jgi:GT2 family glycosyltransferase
VTGQLAIVVVSHSSGATLGDCVARVLSNPEVAELALVDNRSTDGSVEQVQERFAADPRLSVRRNSANLGFAVACNQGAAATRAPYLMFLNPDCLLEPATVARLLELARRHPDAGVVGADCARRPRPPRARRAAARSDPVAQPDHGRCGWIASSPAGPPSPASRCRHPRVRAR